MSARRRNGATARRRDPLDVALHSLGTLESAVGRVAYCGARAPGAAVRCGLAAGHDIAGEYSSDHASVIRDEQGGIIAAGLTWSRSSSPAEPQMHRPDGTTVDRGDGETAELAGELANLRQSDAFGHTLYVSAEDDADRQRRRATLAENALTQVQAMCDRLIRSAPPGSAEAEFARQVFAATAIDYDGDPS